MVQRQCSAQTKAGERCRSWAMPGTDWCVNHDPKRVVELSAWRKKGGHGRSNASRARKALDPTTGRLDVAARVLDAMTKVEAGAMQHGPANAIANLARAYIAVVGDSELQTRLDELERTLAELKAS